MPVRQAFRSLLKQPGLLVAVILTIGIGIAANVTVFSVIRHTLLGSLAFRDSHRLVQIWQTNAAVGNVPVPYPDFLDWRDTANGFDGMAAYTFQAMNKVSLLGEGHPEQIQATMASHDLFALLGSSMILGRSFSATEQDRKQRVIVLNEALLRRKFASDPGIIGHSIRLGAMSFTVVGVVAQRQAFPVWADLWMPLSLIESMLQQSRQFRPLEIVARLRRDHDTSAAQAQMITIANRIASDHPGTNRDTSASVISLHDQMTAPLRPALLAAWLTVSLVLMVACANVAHLLLVRTIARRRELAIRSSLGASSKNLFMLLANEGLVLTGLGGLFAVFVACLLLSALQAWAAGSLVRTEHLPMDSVVILFAAGATLLAALIVIIPAWLLISNTDMNDVRKQGDAHAYSRRSCCGSALMVSEVGLSFAVFAGAILLTRSFDALLTTDPGFEGKQVLALDIVLPGGPAGWERALKSFETKLAPPIRALPSVEAVATTNMSPMSLERTEWSRYTVRFERKDSGQSPGSAPTAQVRWVSEEYFRALKVPLKRGRLLTAADRGQPRRLINETLARRYFANENPIAKELTLNIGAAQSNIVEIVGVVGDLRDLGVDAEPQPTLYMLDTSPRMTLLIRSAGDPHNVVQAVTRIIREAEPEAPISRSQTIDAIAQSSMSRQRVSMALMATLAVLAGALLVVGIYGVLSFGIGRRTREFGIRTAIGALPRDVVRLVLMEGLYTTGVGLAVGVLLFSAVSRIFRALLYKIVPTDVITLTSAAAMIVVLSLLAMAVPARRASITDPNTILKQG
ncbi:MAG TPA: ADOP family duplicated permease [Bryobacteraceae bacterium]|nr:ADOP family duplicated permease [Bryobacteraceae bacterium]